MKKRNIFTLAVTFLVTACSSLDKQYNHDISSTAKLAALKSYKIDDGFINIRVTSFGCTFRNSFDFKVTNLRENAIKVVQKKEDLCQMNPINLSLDYSIRHLNLDFTRPIKVVNPIESKEIAYVSNASINLGKH